MESEIVIRVAVKNLKQSEESRNPQPAYRIGLGVARGRAELLQRLATKYAPEPEKDLVTAAARCQVTPSATWRYSVCPGQR